MAVRDGNTVFMDRFCGTQTRKTYTSTGNTMSIRFMSDGFLEYKGFGLSYKAVGPGMFSQSFTFILPVTKLVCYLCLSCKVHSFSLISIGIECHLQVTTLKVLTFVHNSFSKF